ncbi:glycosyltransferase [Qipengyuania qiaonensis]|uniref:Glycosyltransferase n=1 Tax=Qipengyuania qiaonensis TaxID=2867240 RepID=A0ABS7J8N4_9SPHN|nr:glycosyltransferase [Qipengyuania qiaonensis]
MTIDPALAITVCICTFRRESIADTLQSVANLDPALRPVEVVVVDNDETDHARTRIEQAGEAAGLPLRYVHAPARNISIARNAALDACETRWAALIDDDEIARPDWLTALAALTGNAEAVIGRSQASYSNELPAWVARCDFHSNRIEGSTANAYTSNALLDIDFVREAGLRFRLDLGQTGGEDTLFFRQFERAGGRIVYQPLSVVDEEVPVARANMRWVLRRSYRSGQTHAMIAAELAPRDYARLPLTAGAKLIACTAMGVLNLWRPTSGRRWLRRGALHAGALAYVMNRSTLREYGS